MKSNGAACAQQATSFSRILEDASFGNSVAICGVGIPRKGKPFHTRLVPCFSLHHDMYSFMRPLSFGLCLRRGIRPACLTFCFSSRALLTLAGTGNTVSAGIWQLNHVSAGTLDPVLLFSLSRWPQTTMTLRILYARVMLDRPVTGWAAGYDIVGSTGESSLIYYTPSPTIHPSLLSPYLV